jgi:hypothetical protein
LKYILKDNDGWIKNNAFSVHGLSWGITTAFTYRNHGLSLQPTMAANLKHKFKPWATWTGLSSADHPSAIISTVNDANLVVPKSRKWQFDIPLM